MADNIEHLMLEQFRRVREDIAKLADEIRDVKIGNVALNHHRLGTEWKQQADSEAIDGLRKRMDRVERRLEISEPDPASPTSLSEDGFPFQPPPRRK